MKLLVRFYVAEESRGVWDNNYVELVVPSTSDYRDDVARMCREGVWVKDTFIPPQRILKATLKLCGA